MEKIKKILIIEDEAITAMLLKMELQDRGFEVCRFTANSIAAQDLFHKENPDAVLMDIRLTKGLDGIETAKLFLQHKPRLPIIFMTGYEDEAIKSQAMQLQPLAYLTKPVNIDHIAHLIAKYFNDG